MLTVDLRRLVLRVEADLHERVGVQDGVEGRWRAAYATAREVGRTAAGWESWVGERVTQAAVAWVLTTVFVRFCEDNRLVSPVWLAGPPARVAEAVDAQHAFLRAQVHADRDVTDREWLVETVNHLSETPATAGLVAGDNPLWLVAPSGDMASKILAFWRATTEAGVLVRSFENPALDTRFLGDVYQDLSESARDQFALCRPRSSWRSSSST